MNEGERDATRLENGPSLAGLATLEARDLAAFGSSGGGSGSGRRCGSGLGGRGSRGSSTRGSVVASGSSSTGTTEELGELSGSLAIVGNDELIQIV